MAESSISMVQGHDISELEEALYAQQQLLQKLNTELDVEREASASAAIEALSMILRLQGEKASLKLEATQYKRMAEEKMCHAEESLAVFEDLIYQREMEIASLEFQVQAYRYRLLSLGLNDLGVYENKYPENMLMQRNDTSFTEKIVTGNLRRLNSLPPQVPIKDPNPKKTFIDKKRPLTPMSDSSSSPFEEHTTREINDSGKKLGSSVTVDLNLYWDQINKLDERVKEFSDNKDSIRKNKQALWKGGTWSPSMFSQMSNGTSIDGAISDQVKHQEVITDSVNSASSSNVQDIFEVVPQVTEKCKAKKDYYSKLTVNCDDKPDLVSEEDLMESPNQIKTMLLTASQEKNTSSKSKTIERCVSSAFQAVNVGNSPPELKQINRRIERLERARNSTRHEIVCRGEEELNLLKEIREQLNSIQSEMKSSRSKKSFFPLEPSLDTLQEAMLYFWM
ncbi:uncharacterized protein LOC126668277 [Mercurialis annua]|uniref:uncharacterized protein LOC126668277 n=1 Tax=Mercurialis annua TaxID=3986 RepID=UPI00215E8902|nr:uncharacterized protein LOC126668277 [Mercurialis annua]